LTKCLVFWYVCWLPLDHIRTVIYKKTQITNMDMKKCKRDINIVKGHTVTVENPQNNIKKLFRLAMYKRCCQKH